MGNVVIEGYLKKLKKYLMSSKNFTVGTTAPLEKLDEKIKAAACMVLSARLAQAEDVERSQLLKVQVAPYK